MGVLIVLLLILKIINSKIIFIVLIAGGILSLLRVWNLNWVIVLLIKRCFKKIRLLKRVKVNVNKRDIFFYFETEDY